MVGKITPQGGFQKFTLPITGDANGITVGPDGKIWLTLLNNTGYYIIHIAW